MSKRPRIERNVEENQGPATKKDTFFRLPLKKSSNSTEIFKKPSFYALSALEVRESFYFLIKKRYIFI
jgi:hypothetical protein